MRRIFLALIIALLLTSCGGGGPTGGGPSIALPPGAPSPAPTSTPATVSISFAAQPQETPVQLPPVAGFTITIDFPAMNGTGTVTVTASTIAPSGVPPLSQMTDYTNNPLNPPSATAVPLIYISIASNSPITTLGTPGFTVTLPSSVDTNGRRFYFPRLEQQSWNVLNGAASNGVNSAYVKINPNGLRLALGTAAENFALAYCSLAHIQLQLKNQLVAGAPATETLAIFAQDALGYPIDGPLSHPITISISDQNGDTSLQTPSVSDISTPVQLSYNGKLDQFSLTATYQSVTDTQTFTTALPIGVPLIPSGTTYPPLMQRFVLGSDGNFWTPFAYGVARVSPAGQFTYFADPNYQHTGPSGVIAEGSDGNVWIFYGVTGGGGVDRVTPSGQFTSFPFTTSACCGSRSLVLGPDGALYFPGGPGVERIDMAGTMSTVVSGIAPSYMILGPDNNLWASGANGAIYKITLAGQVTTYTPSPGTDALDFIIGPDGNFWAPYAHLTPTLVKFNTQGTLVSQSPLTYAPSFLSPSTYPLPTAPQRLGDMTKDSLGNVYIGDPHIGGVIRVTPSGSYSEYPSTGAAVDEPVDLLFTNGKLYVSHIIPPPSGSGLAQDSLAAVDPSLW